MTEIQVFEVKLPGDAILRPAIGEEFRCCGSIIGEVWKDAEGAIRCTPCAIRHDKSHHGHRAVATGETTSHVIVGVQSASYVEI